MIGKATYQLRSVEGLTWRQVGKRLGCPTKDCQEAAETFAQATDQPWPVLRRTVFRRRAYELRVAGRGWSEIGGALNLGTQTVRTYALEHARTVGVPLPTPPDPTGERAYRLWEQGATLETIAQETDLSVQQARRRARTHAKEKGLLWPFPRRKRPLLGEAFDLAARIYTELSHGIGWGKTGQPSWTALAVELGRSRVGMAKLVQRYAEQEGLAWPPAQPSSPQERAYRLKLSGKTWGEVLAQVDEYTHLPGVIRAARVWAKKNNLAWPLGAAA